MHYFVLRRAFFLVEIKLVANDHHPVLFVVVRLCLQEAVAFVSVAILGLFRVSESFNDLVRARFFLFRL